MTNKTWQCDSVDADVFVPDSRVGGDETGEEVAAGSRVEVDHFDAILAQPVDPALEGAALADDDAAEAELADQPRAVPAWREGRHHGQVAVAPLASCVAKGVGLAVRAGIAVLHAAVVAGAEQVTIGCEDGRPNGNAAFG